MKKMCDIFKCLVMMTLGISIIGCAPLQKKIVEYSDDKEQCFLNTKNATQFTYKKEEYTILEDTVSNSSMGEWLGYIRKFVVIDAEGKILWQEAIEKTTSRSLSDLADSTSEARYIIPYINVYAAQNDDSYLIIDVNGGYHKAVQSNLVTKHDLMFDFTKNYNKQTDRFKVNPEDATQLICSDEIYQVTSKVVSKKELGAYIDILMENVTFDVETKIPLTKKELNKISWSGKEGHQRKNWIYTEIYEIYGVDTQDAIAVKVNNQYYVAKKK